MSIFGLPVISWVPYFLSGFLAQVFGIEFVEYIYMYFISRFLPATHSRRLHPILTYIYIRIQTFVQSISDLQIR